LNFIEVLPALLYPRTKMLIRKKLYHRAAGFTDSLIYQKSTLPKINAE